MKSKVLCAGILSVLVSSCAAPTSNLGAVDSAAVKQEENEQRRILVAQYKRDHERVMRVTAPLFHAAAEICPAKAKPSWGVFSLTSLAEWEKDFRPAIREETGLTDAPTFMYVEVGGPLDKAGIRAGDILLAVNGNAYDADEDGLEEAKEDYLELRATPSEVKILRAGVEGTVNVTPDRLPQLLVNYDSMSNDINAYADGNSLNVLRGLLRAIPEDPAFAMVLAHEIAHNCEEHIEAKTKNAFLGMLVDSVVAGATGVAGNSFQKAGAEAYSQDFEREADYVGLYYMARAGQPLQEGITMYRLLTAETGGGVKAGYGSSHPSNPERFIRMQAVMKEIEAKRAAGQPLLPDRKK